MPLFTWSQDLSVGVKDFDNQHKELISLINELHDSMAAGKSREVINNVLTKLVNYTRNHFAAEENMMRSHNYIGYLNHKSEHENLTVKVVEIKAKLDRGNMIISVELMNFLKDWLTKHIIGVDRKYGPFFAQKGIV